MYSPHKHSYLQSRTQGINPRIINRTVGLAREQPTIDEFDLEPPFLRLLSEQPCIPIPHIDVTRRPLAFGRWALPKLRRELHNKDEQVVINAITSVTDLVHDPERCYEAVRLRIPDRLVDLLIRENPAIRERTCMALTVIAGLADGRSAIVQNKEMLKNLAMLLEDEEEAVRMKLANLLEMISRTWMAADELIEFGFIQLLFGLITRELEPIVIMHLETLHALTYGDGKEQALECGGFHILVNMLSNETDCVLRSKIADCLLTLTSTCPGKELAYDKRILAKLTKLLYVEDKNVYASAASAIVFCTIKSWSKLRAKEIGAELYERLVTLTNDWHHPPAQLYSIKALSNICEHPEIRKTVYDKYLDELNGIIVGDNEDLRRHKEILLSIVNWVPWSGVKYDDEA